MLLLLSYKEYQIFFKGFASSFVSFIEGPNVGTYEVSDCSNNVSA
jgi:hypothetical protein